MEKRRINVRAIVWRDGKLLGVRHKDDDGTPNEYWAVPGGGLDPLESLRDGVKREVFEELGVRAEVGSLLATQQFHSKRTDFDEELEFFFAVNDSADFDTIDLSKTSHGLEELSEVAFIDPKAVAIKPELLATLDIAAVIAGTERVEVKNYL